MVILRLLLIALVSLYPAGIAFAGSSEDLAGMMQTLQQNLGPVSRFVVALSYVMGLWFITDAVFRLKKYGQARTMMSSNTSMAKPIILMIIGAALLYFPTFVTVSIQSLWVYGSSSSVIRYPVGLSSWDAFTHPLIDVIRLFGLIAVVRGLVILTKLAGESTQPGSVGKGLMHILAGTLAINIVGTINVIKATFGFG
jgi:intracellular multiplication protein IcmC